VGQRIFQLYVPVCMYRYSMHSTAEHIIKLNYTRVHELDYRSASPYSTPYMYFKLQIFSNENKPTAKTGIIPSPQLSGTLSRPDSNRFRIIIGRNHHDVLREFLLSTCPMEEEEEEGMPWNHPSPELQFPNCAKEPLVLVRRTFPIDSIQIARRDCSRAIPGARRN
jgi:hypothetical protein